MLAVGVAAPLDARAAVDPCAARSLSTAFSQWGDYNDYFLVNNGDFEGGSRGWTAANRASLVWDNEPWRVNGWFDRLSARLDPGATLTSATFCVAEREDSLRLFIRHPGVQGAKLIVRVTVSDGTRTDAKSYEVANDGYGWTPSEPMKFPNVRNINGELFVTLAFQSAGTRANWSVDDVMVDPFKSK